MAVRGRKGALLIAGCGLLLGTAAQAAPCETATTEADVQAGIDAGLAAFSAMEPDAMAVAETQTLQAVSCLGAVLPPPAAARVHGLVGMAAFVAQDADRELSALAAARAVDPGFTWPEETVPAGHALRKDLAAAATPAPGQPLELDKGLTAWSDGVEATVVPPGRPALLQVGASTDDLSASAWRMPGDPLPPGAVLGEAPDMLQAGDTGAVRRRLAWTALGTGSRPG
jgi:hypothetical protein